MPRHFYPLDIEPNAELKSRNSFGVNARAQELVTLRHESQLPSLHTWLAKRDALILGGGSNLLFTDDIALPVIAVALHRPPQIDRQTDGSVLVHASAGQNWHDFVRWTLDQGLAGLENLSLIPGTVGASPIQNIGAYGVEIKDRFDSLRAWNLITGQLRCMNAEQCQFAYRDSVFKHEFAKDWLVLSVTFRLAQVKDAKLNINYGELAELHPQTPIDVSNAVIKIRQQKLPDPAVTGNAGSFFKNPIVLTTQARALQTQWPTLPCYPEANQERSKLSAAWLIDQCGWKGFRDGDAGVHSRHALVLVNHGTATGREISALAQRIQASVAQRFGIHLDPEPIQVPT